jgi:hypothetical protein
MLRFREIEEVSGSPQFGNGGPDGWGFHLWGNDRDSQQPYRDLLERFAEECPRFKILSSKFDLSQDPLECQALWDSKPVWVYCETSLDYIWFWSEERVVTDDIRSALLEFWGH